MSNPETAMNLSFPTQTNLELLVSDGPGPTCNERWYRSSFCPSGKETEPLEPPPPPTQTQNPSEVIIFWGGGELRIISDSTDTSGIYRAFCYLKRVTSPFVVQLERGQP